MNILNENLHTHNMFPKFPTWTDVVRVMTFPVTSDDACQLTLTCDDLLTLSVTFVTSCGGRGHGRNRDDEKGLGGEAGFERI